MAHQSSFPGSRREFITLLGGTAAAWPIAARAQKLQSPQKPVIGFLNGGYENKSLVAAFKQGLAQGGFVADKDVAIEFRWAKFQSATLSVTERSAPRTDPVSTCIWGPKALDRLSRGAS
jgi:hypothetical protein